MRGDIAQDAHHCPAGLATATLVSLPWLGKRAPHVTLGAGLVTIGSDAVGLPLARERAEASLLSKLFFATEPKVRGSNPFGRASGSPAFCGTFLVK